MSPPLLETLYWIRPQAFWLLLAVPLIVLLAWVRGRQRRRWKDVVDPHLLPHLLVDGGRAARAWPWAVLLGWTLAVTALAGPSWRTQAQPLLQASAPLVAVLDLSGRTTATDLPPSRLLQARAKLATLLREREGGQMALVVYADDAYTVAPLTDDVANIALYLDALSPQVMPADGQRTDRAIDWATQLLQRAGMREGRILLLTDRADAAAVAAAAQARAQGMQVSVLGLGTAAGAAYRDGRGQIGTAALDEPSLRRLASAGGGEYRRLGSGDSDLRALGVLRAVASGTGQQRGDTVQWRDEGFWLLIPLMLLALLAFRRHAPLLGLVLVLAWAPLPPAHAQATGGAGAPAPAPTGSLWLRADQQQQRRIEQGVHAYRAGDFAAAAQQFEGIGTAEAYYNLGNARARLNDLDAAVEAYDKALAVRPGMPDAVANRAVVDAARKRKPPPGGGQGQPPSPPQGTPPKQAGGQGQPEPSHQGEGQPGTPAPPPPPPKPGEPASADRGQQGPAPPTPPDSATQQQADAQQRQRMQDALRQAQDGKGGTDERAAAARAPSMTPQQREQQQAVEAWMRRVPDQPGDLLRAKFQLENQRRKQEGR